MSVLTCGSDGVAVRAEELQAAPAPREGERPHLEATAPRRDPQGRPGAARSLPSVHCGFVLVQFVARGCWLSVAELCASLQ
eukprot:453809-Rhodomonas_salina.1